MIVYSNVVFYTIQLTVVLTKPQKYLYLFVLVGE